MANTTLLRANRVAVKANGENLVADFYRTHTAVGSIHSENTEWKAPENVTNKTAARESFRVWAIEHAEEFNIQYDPVDRRTEGNVRKANYTTDEELVSDATSMLIAELRPLADKCKYGIEWAGVEHEDIVPMTKTATGRDLSTMGIENGKYSKSQNWAWAFVKFTMQFKFKGEVCYLPVEMQLVSGQLKKSGMNITDMNAKVKAEILEAKLATEAELDPPKESKSKANKAEDKPEDTKAEEPAPAPAEETPKEEDKKPKRGRKSKKDKEAEQNAQ